MTDYGKVLEEEGFVKESDDVLTTSDVQRTYNVYTKSITIPQREVYNGRVIERPPLERRCLIRLEEGGSIDDEDIVQVFIDVFDRDRKIWEYSTSLYDSEEDHLRRVLSLII